MQVCQSTLHKSVLWQAGKRQPKRTLKIEYQYGDIFCIERVIFDAKNMKYLRGHKTFKTFFWNDEGL